MDPDALPSADELWWRFAIAAAIGMARGRAGDAGEARFTYDTEHQVLTYAEASDRLCMQRLYNGRMVLWGRTSQSAPASTWTGIPGWATSDAVHESLDRIGATFLLWHARDGWESATADPRIESALEAILDSAVDPDVLDAARDGRLDDVMLADLGIADDVAASEVLRGASSEAPPVQGTIRRLLALEIEEQMRRTPERDRMLPQRPVAIVRWATVAKPPAGFTYAVRSGRDGIVRTNDFLPRLSQAALRSLTNVLAQLYVDEATDAGGAWLYARVRFNGVQAQLDRAFDSQPSWATKPLTLEELAEEMARRAPAWRPAWSRLLPPAQVERADGSGHASVAGPSGQLMA